MTHRVVEIAWLPRSASEWQTFTSARAEAARLWNDVVVRHHRIRRMRLKWPTRGRWLKWAKKRYPKLYSQSVQQILMEFLESVRSAGQLRKNGHDDANYPWRFTKYKDVTYTNQSAKIYDGWLRLPNGASGVLWIRIPKRIELPGRLMEVILSFGRVRIVCKLPEAASVEPTQTIGVDLGVNTMIAAGNEEQAVLVSGREAKATVQWREKRLASIWSAQSRLKKGSRRWRRLERRKMRMLEKSRNRLRDITHKATRIVANAFPNAKVIVGEPFNKNDRDAPKKMSKVLSKKVKQQIGSIQTAKIIAQLAYKLAGATEVPEHYTSQTCPVCGARRRMRRIYRCPCGFVAPRDVVGLTNIRRIGIHGQMVCSPAVPTQIVYALPHRKYPGATQVVPAEPRHVARRVA